MISRAILHQAKAFLCWDIFDDLSIQLIPALNSTAFYFPPQNDLHSIVLFLAEDKTDFAEPLFLLFHEAGHVRQYRKIGDRKTYNQLLQSPDGAKRADFEKCAWDEAYKLFIYFLKKHNIISKELIDSFKSFSQKCINSYADRGKDGNLDFD